MSETTTTATGSTPSTGSTANPRRTTLASVADFTQLPGFAAGREARAYSVRLPAATANPRRTVLMTAPAPRLPRD
ncbi:hypothetical protein [Streptomyces sp. TLI_171]|uniref:hypothetical protein n=1 Tax=Streptomyces sp. TLI_171 TaxID=1938859 RepID=UPI000C1A05A3|nr:hypothetical protein [Streptomyces sp. TLI_171]RKE21315.1 hypothetical protein BX266_4695 [Streptomyces sp. TLI_171]